jgi:murein DD-endopeptidase MepM/ murein hydrolase activator NlpD
VPVRFLLALAIVLFVAALGASARAQSSATARASAAVISGDLGRVAFVKASGNDGSSRSAPAKTPDGVVLGDGFVSVTTSTGRLSASAQAEADDVELLGGIVTAALVSRIAEDKGDGVKYRGSVTGLVVGDKEIDEVKGEKTYRFDGGKVVTNSGGAGLVVTLTDDVEGAPAGTRIVVADVSASAARGAAPSPEPTASPEKTSTPAPTPTATATATPKPKKPAGYKTRLMRRSFVFPVGGRTTIGGEFGSFRADTGAHQGNDLFADFGTPVVAAADGRLANVGSLPISGNRLWVYADSGDEFFYAHLSAFSPAAVNDRHVEAGTILGYVGNTGDAEPTPPHLHFEIHPNGGDAVDPRPFLVAWQKRAGNTLSDTAERPGALVEVRDFIGEG